MNLESNRNQAQPLSRDATLRRLVAPILKRHRDVAYIGRTLLIRPISHYARYVYLESSGWGQMFTPYPGASHLFLPLFGLTNRHAIWLSGSCGPGFEWNAHDLAARFEQQIEDVALPWLRAINSLGAYRDFAYGEQMFGAPLNAYPEESALLELAAGNLDRVHHLCTMVAEDPHKRETSPGGRHRIVNLVLPALEAGDMRLLGALLREWEERSVDELGIASVWRQMPYPFEKTGS